MICLKQYIFLILNILNLLLLQEEILIDPLHRIHLIHLSIVDEEYFTKRPLVHYSHDLKIGKRHFLTLEAWLSNQTLTVTLVLGVFLLL